MNTFQMLFEEVMSSIEENVWWHISPVKFTKFDITKCGSGMGTSFYGHGIYFSKSRETCDYYAEQMKDSYGKLYCYEVSVNGNLKSENDKIEVDGRSLGVLELYNELVENGLSEKEASQKMVDDYGIDGITYWSQEDGDSLVVFSDAIIQVLNVEEV